MKFFLKCEKALHICDKSQYNEANFFEKLLLKLHLFICKLCRSHAKRNTKLTHTLKTAQLKTLSPHDKKILENKIKREIENDRQI